MINHKMSKRLQFLIAAVAIVFGLLTFFAGSRVLLNISEPDYIVFLPLLIFNILMGFIYITTGFIILRNAQKGRVASKVIFMLNVLVLGIILLLYFFSSDQIAVDSIVAMVFRTTVWLAIYWSLKNCLSSNERKGLIQF